MIFAWMRRISILHLLGVLLAVVWVLGRFYGPYTWRGVNWGIRDFDFPGVPLVIDGDTVVVFQPDQTFTILELKSGKVLQRGKPYPGGEPWIQRTHGGDAGRIVGNLVLLLKNGSFRAVYSKLNGEMLLDSPDVVIGYQHKVSGKYLFLADRDKWLTAVNSESAAVRLLGKYEGYDYGNGRIYGIACRDGGDEGRCVRSVDPDNGKVEWEVEVEGDGWSNAFLFEGTVHLLTSSPTATSLPLPSISEEGERLPDVHPGSEHYDTIMQAYIAQSGHGVQERVKLPNPGFPLPGNAMILMSYVSNSDLGGGVYWGGISRDWHQVRRHHVIDYIDDTHTWERRINCVDIATAMGRERGLEYLPKILQCRFVANDDILVYSTNQGKVEAIDRLTGGSLWLYSFPRSLWPLWNARHDSGLSNLSMRKWEKNARRKVYPREQFKPHELLRLGWVSVFYDEERMFYDADLAPEGMLGVSARDEPGPAHPPYTLDPDPVIFDDTGVALAAVLCRLVIVSPLVGMGIFVLCIARRRYYFRYIFFLLLLVVFDVTVIYYFGLYSRSTFSKMLPAINFAFLALVLSLLAHRKTPKTAPPAQE